jgi:hypothetical protein
VVAAGSAWIALRYGQGDANPKGALAAIFALIGGYMALLFALQWLDIGRAESTDPETELWKEMALRPIDEDALRARQETWGTARKSVSTGALITLLIFLTVPPVYLLETFTPLYVGVPLIVGVALWKSVRLMMPGGDFDQAYERTSRALAPLGLTVVEHPSLSIEPKGVAPYRMGPALHGALVLAGERHGHAVDVSMPVGAGVRSPSSVTVHAPASEPFEFRARDGRLKAADGAPAAVRDSLSEIPNSPVWNGARGRADADGITIERKNAGGEDWLRDLWLAERVAALLE